MKANKHFFSIKDSRNTKKNLRVDEIEYFTKNTTSSNNVFITQEMNEG